MNSILFTQAPTDHHITRVHEQFLTALHHSQLEVFIEHIPRAELQARIHICSAATIDVTSLPMRNGEQGCYRIYCVRVWPYPRCGSDCLPYILYCEAGEVGPNVTNNRK